MQSKVVWRDLGIVERGLPAVCPRTSDVRIVRVGCGKCWIRMLNPLNSLLLLNIKKDAGSFASAFVSVSVFIYQIKFKSFFVFIVLRKA